MWHAEKPQPRGAAAPLQAYARLAASEHVALGPEVLDLLRVADPSQPPAGTFHLGYVAPANPGPLPEDGAPGPPWAERGRWLGDLFSSVALMRASDKAVLALSADPATPISVYGYNTPRRAELCDVTDTVRKWAAYGEALAATAADDAEPPLWPGLDDAETDDEFDEEFWQDEMVALEPGQRVLRARVKTLAFEVASFDYERRMLCPSCNTTPKYTAVLELVLVATPVTAEGAAAAARQFDVEAHAENHRVLPAEVAVHECKLVARRATFMKAVQAPGGGAMTDEIMGDVELEKLLSRWAPEVARMMADRAIAGRQI